MPDAAKVRDLAWLLELNMGLVMPDAAMVLELARGLELDMGLVMAMAFAHGSA